MALSWLLGDKASGGGITDFLSDPLGRKASEQALQGQLAQGERAMQLQKEMYEQQREDLMPWQEFGVKQLGSLEQRIPGLVDDKFTMEDFFNDPGYQFRLQQGQQAINRAMAAKGLRQSTAAVRGLADFNQGLASQEYQNAWDRWNENRTQQYNMMSNLAGMGQVQSGRLAGAAGQYGTNVGNIMVGQGNAIAAQGMNRANTNAGIFGQLLGGAAYLGGSAITASDERVKENIKPASKEDIEELKAVVKPYTFNYVDDVFGDGDWVGVMAQDLEKTKLGKKIVEEHEGIKFINNQKLASLMLAVMVG